VQGDRLTVVRNADFDQWIIPPLQPRKTHGAPRNAIQPIRSGSILPDMSFWFSPTISSSNIILGIHPSQQRRHFILFDKELRSPHGRLHHCHMMASDTHDGTPDTPDPAALSFLCTTSAAAVAGNPAWNANERSHHLCDDDDDMF